MRNISRVLVCFTLVLMIVAGSCFAYNYYDYYFDEAFVCSAYREWRGFLAYMYPRATSMDNAIAAYMNGEVLQIIDYYGGNGYCYCLGPDGRTGYVAAKNLVLTGVHDSARYENYEYYDVSSTYYENGRYCAYVYPEPSSMGEPVACLYDGETVKLVKWDFYPETHNYCFILTNDGQVGYINKQYVTPSAAPWLEDRYMVNSDYSERGAYLAYMYAEPSSMGDAIARYYNGSIVYVQDWYADSRYALVLGPDYKKGYIKKSWLVKVY